MNEYDFNKFNMPLHHLQDIDKVALGLQHRIYDLLEKATPKKPHRPDRFSDYYCPNCGEIVLKDECCVNNDCRQALDWSVE